MFIITTKKRLMNKAKICKDCGRVIDGIKIKGMKCNGCGADVCYKCNMNYKCNDCHITGRLDYYVEKEIEIMN